MRAKSTSGGSAAATRSDGFFPSLDAARGIAALMVAMSHVGQTPYLDAAGATALLVEGNGLYRIVSNAFGAVIFFFVLSGFVLMLMLRRGPQDTPLAAARFVVSRIFRIFPAVISTLAIFLVVYAVTGRGLAEPEAYTFPTLALNALLFRTDIDGVMWTLQLEMLAVPLIFGAYVMTRRWGVAVLVALLVVFVALSFVGPWTKLLAPQTPLGPIYCFLAGMIACHVGQRHRDIPGARLWLIVGVLGFFAARTLLSWTSNWSTLAETAFASVVVIMLCHDVAAWRLARPLARLFSFYGHISYSFYLLHPLTLLVLWKSQAMATLAGAAVAAGWPPAWLAFALFIGSTIAITPLAWLQQRFVERYGIAIGRNLMRVRNGPPSP